MMAYLNINNHSHYKFTLGMFQLEFTAMVNHASRNEMAGLPFHT
jgi:hypothetical protein